MEIQTNSGREEGFADKRALTEVQKESCIFSIELKNFRLRKLGVGSGLVVLMAPVMVLLATGMEEIILRKRHTGCHMKKSMGKYLTEKMFAINVTTLRVQILPTCLLGHKKKIWETVRRREG